MASLRIIELWKLAALALCPLKCGGIYQEKTGQTRSSHCCILFSSPTLHKQTYSATDSILVKDERNREIILGMKDIGHRRIPERTRRSTWFAEAKNAGGNSGWKFENQTGAKICGLSGALLLAEWDSENRACITHRWLEVNHTHGKDLWKRRGGGSWTRSAFAYALCREGAWLLDHYRLLPS